MRPEQWEPLPLIRPEPPPTWWERNAPAFIFGGAMAFLAALDILGL
jgi:hypothetical protein